MPRVIIRENNEKYNLREKVQGQHQTCVLGIKEVWEIDSSKHEPGHELHTLGRPVLSKASLSARLSVRRGEARLQRFMRTEARRNGEAMEKRQKRGLEVSLGLVVALNYHNPFLNPYEEFQKLKHHPAIKPLLEGATVLQYGARTLNEGGFQIFPGGAIIGCSAGFLNVPKIKGTHTAMKSGMLAAEAAFSVLHAGLNMETYLNNLKNSWIWEELYRAQNYRPRLAISKTQSRILNGLCRKVVVAQATPSCRPFAWINCTQNKNVSQCIQLQIKVNLIGKKI
ncbi:unnamed protein product [Camellia sinensis]